ncbi:MAG: sulfatase [Acidobacteriota bacterium]
MIYRRSLTFLFCFAVVHSGCRPASDRVAADFDLVAGFPMARLGSETREMDLGSPESRRFLVSGWSGDRWDKNRHLNYLLADDAEAVIRFRVLEPRDLTLRIYGRPRDPEAIDGDSIEARVNGIEVASWPVQPNNKRYRVRLDEGLIADGDNELSLRYLRAGAAAGRSEPDKANSRSMIWFSIDLQGRDDGEPPIPMVVDEGSSILMPWGTDLEYYLRLPADSRLLFERIGFVGNAAGALEIELEVDGEPSTRVATFDSPTETADVELGEGSDRIVRLTLRTAEREAVTSMRSGVLLSKPRIRFSEVESTDKARSSSWAAGQGGTAGGGVDRNVLLYVIDTLRADHLGMYGYERPVSPNMDRFAAGATVFENAIAQSSWTRSSMASVFTGLWPIKHDTNGRKDKLSDEALTLAEVVNQAGMETTAIARNWNIFPAFGFSQGFDQFRALKRGNSIDVNESVQYWFENRQDDKPFFLYLHTVEPHGPYRPPEEFKRKFLPADGPRFDLDKHPGSQRTRAMSNEEKRQVAEHLINLYDGEIASNDATFGRLLQDLESRGLMDETLIVVVSDHGEEFLEHGTWEHGKNLFAETLNVPLIIRFPEMGRGDRVTTVVQHIDIMPTILDWLGLPIPPGVEGRSLIPVVESADASSKPDTRLAFSYLELDGLPTQSVVDGEWKFIERIRGDKVIWSGLFNREIDPGDRENLIDDYPIRARYLSMLLEARIQEGSLLTTSEAVIDAETESALRALGYLN